MQVAVGTHSFFICPESRDKDVGGDCILLHFCLQFQKFCLGSILDTMLEKDS